MSKLSRHSGSRDQLAVLRTVLALAGDKAELLAHTESVWQSATFNGLRHTSTLLFDGADAVADGEAFIAALPDAEMAVPHMLVVDAGVKFASHIVVPMQRMTVQIELLLITEDPAKITR